ncbi:sterigmatocystin biosynthesis monooxygenase stcW [Pyrenophora seminiperda CCB06]|uniref:Sterigmatocystin biosynthesis monooxygenase stcW n=1 Tax=Pyrenophora seminiperda CCB06 TaxID=1302712 RepID=A0A3M7MD55_9PLEO|nr:sterigmatocystin biosynthesis monooxygenase stcW [Pyrenophora seminiperda CCB06]
MYFPIHPHVSATKDATTNGETTHVKAANEAATNGEATHPSWLLHENAPENHRPIRVIVIGAGFSGILCGIRIPERIRNCELAIYDKNAGVGGTWLENRYPGAACDVPAHGYQYTFNPNHTWSEVYSPSDEICAYLEKTAEKYGVNRFFKLQHEVRDCTWNQKLGKWYLHVQAPSGDIFEDSCDVLVSARGGLNNKKWPSIEGMSDFKGEIMHSAAWNQDYDFKNKRVGVIGGGSSSIQIVPKLQKIDGTHVDCFFRTRTWITPPMGQKAMEDLGIGSQLEWLPEQIEDFKTDPEAYTKFRIKIESEGNSIHTMMTKGSKMQIQLQKAFDDAMKARLEKRPDIYEALIPSFAPGCRRLTPGPGFLEALQEDNVSLVREKITRIESNGVVTADGKLHECDVLVCATGFYTAVAPPFEIKGLNGRTIQEHWKDRATAYLSLASEQFPNQFIIAGPNCGIADGSFTTMVESMTDYTVKAIRKIQKENIKSMVVKEDRVKDFIAYSDAYFARTVFTDNCRSWFRQGGRGEVSDNVTGLWPGSSLHCQEAVRSPRWEDYEYEYLPEKNGAKPNQLAFLGRGIVAAQMEEKRSPMRLAWYCVPDVLDKEIGIPVAFRPEEKLQYQLRPYSY